MMDALEQRNVLTDRIEELERVLKEQSKDPDIDSKQLEELQDDVEGLRIAKATAVAEQELARTQVTAEQYVRHRTT